MFELKFNQVFVHFIYDSGVMETQNIVRESDKELKCNKRVIVKSTEHAKIDGKGRRHYFVHGEDSKTSVPFSHIKGKGKGKGGEIKPIEREAVYHVMQASLLKSLVQAQTMPLFTMALLVIAGVGIGYVLGTEWGGDTVNNVTDTDNYYQNTDKDNGTIVLSMIELNLPSRSIEIPFDIFNGVRVWKCT